MSTDVLASSNSIALDDGTESRSPSSSQHSDRGTSPSLFMPSTPDGTPPELASIEELALQSASAKGNNSESNSVGNQLSLAGSGTDQPTHPTESTEAPSLNRFDSSDLNHYTHHHQNHHNNSMDTSSEILLSSSSIMKDPETFLNPRTKQDAMIGYLYRALEYALQCLVRESDQSQLENLVNGLLLLQTRLERANTDDEKNRAFEVLRPARVYLAERLEQLGKSVLNDHLDDLMMRIGPVLSQIPLRVGNWIYALVRFEDENFRIKLSFHAEADPQVIVNSVCREMRDNNKFTEDLTENKVRQRVLETIERGPPYAAFPLLAPRTKRSGKRSRIKVPKYKKNASDPMHQSTLSSEKNISSVNAVGSRETGSRHSDISQSFSRAANSRWMPSNSNHQKHERDEPMCMDCYDIRKDVQEEILTALANVVKKLRTQSNELKADTFNRALPS